MSTGRNSSGLPQSVCIRCDSLYTYRAATTTLELAVIDRELELFPKASTNQLCDAVRTQTADGLIKASRTAQEVWPCGDKVIIELILGLPLSPSAAAAAADAELLVSPDTD